MYFSVLLLRAYSINKIAEYIEAEAAEPITRLAWSPRNKTEAKKNACNSYEFCELACIVRTAYLPTYAILWCYNFTWEVFP